MSDENETLQLVFSEEFFEQLLQQGLSTEEIQTLVNEIGAAFESGKLLEDAEALEDIQIDDPELYEKLMGGVSILPMGPRTIH